MTELRVAYDTGGPQALRRKEVEQMLQEPEKGTNAFLIPSMYLGEKEPALEWLEKAYAMRHPTLAPSTRPR